MNFAALPDPVATLAVLTRPLYAWD